MPGYAAYPIGPGGQFTGPDNEGTEGQVAQKNADRTTSWVTIASGVWLPGQSPGDIHYSSGNVGIGTDDPNGSLHIRKTGGFAADTFRIDESDTITQLNWDGNFWQSRGSWKFGSRSETGAGGQVELIAATTGRVIVTSGGMFEFRSGGPDTPSDVILARDGAGQLALRDGSAEQSLRVYDEYTAVDDFERLFVGFDADRAFVRVEADGSGQDQELHLSSRRDVVIWTHGNEKLIAGFNWFGPKTTGTYDNGLATNKWKDGHFAGTVYAGPGIHQGKVSASTDGNEVSAGGLGSYIDPVFGIYTDNTIRAGNGVTITGNTISTVFTNGLVIADDVQIRSGSTPRSLSVYNDYTNATDFERLAIEWINDVCWITSGNPDGAGQRRDMHINAETVKILKAGQNRAQFGNNEIILSRTTRPEATNAYDLGLTTRLWRNCFIAGYHQINPSTAPGDTTDKLYNVAGDLYWDGTQLGGGSTMLPLGPTGDIDTNTTVTEKVQYNHDSPMVAPNAGVTITYQGGYEAPKDKQIFDLSRGGTVLVNDQEIYVEHFGATTTSPDISDELTAALSAGKANVVKLQQGKTYTGFASTIRGENNIFDLNEGTLQKRPVEAGDPNAQEYTGNPNNVWWSPSDDVRPMLLWADVEEFEIRNGTLDGQRSLETISIGQIGGSYMTSTSRAAVVMSGSATGVETTKSKRFRAVDVHCRSFFGVAWSIEWVDHVEIFDCSDEDAGSNFASVSGKFDDVAKTGQINFCHFDKCQLSGDRAENNVPNSGITTGITHLKITECVIDCSLQATSGGWKLQELENAYLAGNTLISEYWKPAGVYWGTSFQCIGDKFINSDPQVFEWCGIGFGGGHFRDLIVADCTFHNAYCGVMNSTYNTRVENCTFTADVDNHNAAFPSRSTAFFALTLSAAFVNNVPTGKAGRTTISGNLFDLGEFANHVAIYFSDDWGQTIIENNTIKGAGWVWNNTSEVEPLTREISWINNDIRRCRAMGRFIGGAKAFRLIGNKVLDWDDREPANISGTTADRSFRNTAGTIAELEVRDNEVFTDITLPFATAWVVWSGTGDVTKVVIDRNDMEVANSQGAIHLAKSGTITDLTERRSGFNNITMSVTNVIDRDPGLLVKDVTAPYTVLKEDRNHLLRVTGTGNVALNASVMQLGEQVTLVNIGGNAITLIGDINGGDAPLTSTAIATKDTAATWSLANIEEAANVTTYWQEGVQAGQIHYPDGNVGIGTTNPVHPLMVQADFGAGVSVIPSGNANDLLFYGGSSAVTGNVWLLNDNIPATGNVIVTVKNTNGTNGAAGAVLQAQVAGGGGDPYVSLVGPPHNNATIGMDRSDPNGTLHIGYGNDPSNMTVGQHLVFDRNGALLPSGNGTQDLGSVAMSYDTLYAQQVFLDDSVNIYNDYVNDTDFERLFVGFDTGTAYIRTEADGSGQGRELRLVSSGNTLQIRPADTLSCLFSNTSINPNKDFTPYGGVSLGTASNPFVNSVLSGYHQIEPSTAPGDTTSKLYNVGGTLTWNGGPVLAGAVVQAEFDKLSAARVIWNALAADSDTFFNDPTITLPQLIDYVKKVSKAIIDIDNL